MDDFVVLERGDAVGGTWWFNTYPGCGCDVPSHLYSFSFAPNPDWTRTYSARPRSRLTCSVSPRTSTSAARAPRHDRDRRRVGRGRAALAGRDRPRRLRARVLVSAAGALSDPKNARVEGLERFQGHMFHSAQWDHDYDLRGKRVAVIGTGASAIQFVPAIAPDVAQMHVSSAPRRGSCRTPTGRSPARERRLYRRFPLLQRLPRGGSTPPASCSCSASSSSRG